MEDDTSTRRLHELGTGTGGRTDGGPGADGELRDALVDATISVERVRELHDVDRDAFLEAVAERTRELGASDGGDLDSVSDVASLLARPGRSLRRVWRSL